ncbi:uncharacterized protein BP5553_02729 [Venustampulla echinocandica]|uniref:Uncharacterized protein n=1 Tax=Venustampulla echinocandica TaxID=2656787 RepID=A0A370TS79_9HELO|nr:uncharacterized protein BP5553_02729 [Venustampulla echinocandica]RDL38389.1 hypothetical protein BP5553_02729 [Venustampulla echinocandica]
MHAGVRVSKRFMMPLHHLQTQETNVTSSSGNPSGFSPHPYSPGEHFCMGAYSRILAQQAEKEGVNEKNHSTLAGDGEISNTRSGSVVGNDSPLVQLSATRSRCHHFSGHITPRPDRPTSKNQDDRVVHLNFPATIHRILTDNGDDDSMDHDKDNTLELVRIT